MKKQTWVGWGLGLTGVFVIMILGISGCAHMGESLEEKEKVYGPNPPAIGKSFASDQLRPGDLWKIYIQASDPDGDMESIVSVVEQTGTGAYPPSFTRIKAENGKEASGYIYLITNGPSGFDFLYNQQLTVSIHIRDKAGHTSQPVSFKVLLLAGKVQKTPPAGGFQEKELGPILVTLRPSSDRTL
jgi:hypothetical protein